MILTASKNRLEVKCEKSAVSISCSQCRSFAVAASVSRALLCHWATISLASSGPVPCAAALFAAARNALPSCDTAFLAARSASSALFLARSWQSSCVCRARAKSASSSSRASASSPKSNMLIYGIMRLKNSSLSTMPMSIGETASSSGLGGGR